MELYFTRHGKTEWNNQGRFQGREGDSPLLPSSFAEIELLGNRLSEVPFTKIICSPQKRALDTAKGIQDKLNNPCEIILREGLREIGLGELEGSKIEKAREKYGKELDALRYQPHLYNPSKFGGEDYKEMLERSMKVVFEAMEIYSTGPLLFVSHGVTLTGLIQTLVGEPLESVRKMGGLDNSTLSIVKTINNTLKPPFHLELWNDVKHLAE